MLYPKSKAPHLTPQLFQTPTSEYRGAPFWAWNGKLTQKELAEQIDIFHQMGLGGFHMHVRTGLDVPYLEDEFMSFVRFCVGQAKRHGMLAWLYDEDRWPSGSAGGKVTAGKPENARKTLLFTPRPYALDRPHRPTSSQPGRGQESVRQDNGVLLAVYDVCLDADGCLRSARRIAPDAAPQGVKWYAYQEHATADPWFNDQAYVDTLRPEAIREFLAATHEAYRREVGADFGAAIPGIFTDEPQFAPKEALAFPDQQKDLFLSWTDRLPALYRERFGEDLLDVLPELLWELPNGRLSRARWRFHNLVTDVFCDSYIRQVGGWCRENGLLLTGHVMGEPTLESQTQAVGDAMRCYPDFGLPGIDMLCNFHEYTTAKQAQSMARQMGAEGVLSELYGVTGWDYDFRGYKLQGDWQAALGVTLRVPHLSWLTMKGEAKRDYPASISYQSPWWPEFSLIEDHFARLNTALTRGKPVSTVAVLHPIESYWLRWGPASQTLSARQQMEEQFASLCERLLFAAIDFDYLCEARLPQQCPAGSFPLQVGAMAYRVVLVPPVCTLRATTVQRLEDFQRQGGRVLFLGDCPALIDGEESPLAQPLYARSEHPGFDCEAILRALEPERFLDIRTASGRRTDTLLFQLRQDGPEKWLFLCNGKDPESPDVDPAPTLRFTLKGEYALEEYDTLTGGIRPLPAACQDGRTVFHRTWHIHDSLLLRLTPGREAKHPAPPQTDGAYISAASEDGHTVFEHTRHLHESPLLPSAPGREAEHPAPPQTGVTCLSAASEDGHTVFEHTRHLHESPLLPSTPGQGAEQPAPQPIPLAPDVLLEPVPITLTEPNMLLLDMAEYSLNGGTFYSQEELLRIDNLAREELGIPLRRKEVVQPYLLPEAPCPDRLRLRFRIESGIQLAGASLALEDPASTEITLNGQQVDPAPTGFFVDHSIQTIPLPPLHIGENLLEVQAPIGPRTNLEAFYLLGDFGVQAAGAQKRLTPPIRKLSWGDIVPQGLPFYTGNIRYACRVRTQGGFTLRVPHYRGGLVKVFLDGKPVGRIAFSPYALPIPAAPGDHALEILLYGTRYNGFAQLHHTQGVYFYQSPNSWRSAGDLWSYEYCLKAAGVLKSPELYGAQFLPATQPPRLAAVPSGHIADKS